METSTFRFHSINVIFLRIIFNSDVNLKLARTSTKEQTDAVEEEKKGKHTVLLCECSYCSKITQRRLCLLDDFIMGVVVFGMVHTVCVSYSETSAAGRTSHSLESVSAYELGSVQPRTGHMPSHCGDCIRAVWNSSSPELAVITQWRKVWPFFCFTYFLAAASSNQIFCMLVLRRGFI